MGRTVGIDLGTTNSVVAVMEAGEPTVIPNSEGGRTTPSVVGFTKTGERLVGIQAKRQAVLNPERTISSIKRHMGTDYKVTIDNKTFTPEEISAMILQKLKADAEAYLGEAVTDAVITVPAYFNDAQRTATKTAGEIAGLNVIRIINEPTAASLAYGLDKKKNETILVFDLGGGTFDVSILEVGDGVFEVKSTAGDTHLGGDDWDQRIVDYVADEFMKQEGIDLRKDRQALQRLREAAEKAKIELSTVVQTSINLPFITATQDGPKHLEMTLTRAKFEELTEDLLQRVIGPFKRAMADAGVTEKDIEEIILVGGATRMPMVYELVKKIGGREPHKGVNPDEVVAVGAAIQAGVLKGDVKDVVLLDVTPLTLGIETLGGVFTKLIERNTTIPTRKSDIFTTAADGQTDVEIHVLQGEREMARDNKTLGRFHLVGIPPAPRGVPQIEVTFDIDANGIIHVSAKDLGTGNEQAITIKGDRKLSEEDIKRMMDEAKKFEAEDKQKKEEIELRNVADTAIFSAEKLLKEHGNTLEPADKEKVECGIADLRKALEADQSDEIRAKMDTLTEAVYAITTKIYQKAQAERQAQQQEAGAAGGGSGGSRGSGDENVVDADFKVKDE